jgi:hypothetical protein
MARRKFGNRPTSVGGTRVDSRREARRLIELRLLEKAGSISGLRTQVRYELTPAATNPTERASHYVADFVYTDENGDLVVEDAKGFRTSEYILKRKVMRWRYGIVIREV